MRPSFVVQIGLISDTHIPHRLAALPPALVKLLAGVDLIIHAGDLDDPAILNELRLIAPVRAVRGNPHVRAPWPNDQRLPLHLDLDVQGNRIVVTHGHMSVLNSFVDKLWLLVPERRERINRRLMARLARSLPGADVYVFGHSHHATVARMNGSLFVNPGAVCRTRGDEPSIGRLQVTLSRVDAAIIPLLDVGSGIGVAARDGEVMNNERPIIGITLGDPAGVGPEITAKALARATVWSHSRPVVIGDAGTLVRAVMLQDLSLVPHMITDIAAARFDPVAPDVLDTRAVKLESLRDGEVSAIGGAAAAAYVKQATDLALNGHVDAIVTNPINKAALQAAGVPYVGHTEMLADWTGAGRVTTMLATPGLRVVHVTRHVPLRDVAAYITRDRVLETIRLTQSGLREMGIARPRVAVAALNPHGGDEGLVGREEIEEIAPAVLAAQKDGIDARGPIPADSVFFRAIRNEFDAVVAMYHDQGHIPIKTHGFEQSVTVTLGLPIVRTSVDHGTAFDIAWRGVASEESLLEAIKLAALLVSSQAADGTR